MPIEMDSELSDHRKNSVRLLVAEFERRGISLRLEPGTVLLQLLWFLVSWQTIKPYKWQEFNMQIIQLVINAVPEFPQNAAVVNL